MNNTIKYFKQISQIPRPSSHEEKIKDYLCRFAKNLNLECFSDEKYNVVIKKPSNKNSRKVLILQGHTDMVCEKNKDVNFDFITQPIKVVEEGGFLKAKGTTLGADNGIGLGMILSLLSDKKLKIPNLECVFTTQEETTMAGALNLNTRLLKGKHLLSIDGTEEGSIIVSSAGMAVVKISKKINFSCSQNNFFEISVSGLSGGHSGTEINKNRLNAIKVLFEILNTLDDFCFCFVSGGGKANAIPRECNAVIFAPNLTINLIEKKANCLMKKYKLIEKSIKLEIKQTGLENKNIFSKQDSKNLLNFICSFKNGVLENERGGFTIVSNNVANIQLNDKNLEVDVSLRSSKIASENFYLKNLGNLAKSFNFDFKIINKAPFFEEKENSYLQKLCQSTFKNLFKKDAIVEGVHAGLEGGVFAKKIKDIDICVISPDIFDAHSPCERVDIKSIKRVYKWLEKIVEEF